MRIFLLFITLFVFTSLLNAGDYVIKLASYLNKDGLLHQISLLDPNIKNNITIVEEDSYYKVFTKYPTSKENAYKQLPKYQKVFSDAYVMLDRYKKEQKNSIDIYKTLQNGKENTNITTIQKKQQILSPENSIQQSVPVLEDILVNKTYYICSNEIKDITEKFLVKATFSENFVTYTTLIGTLSPLKMRYIIKNNRLYLVKDNKISLSQYSSIEKILFDYLLFAKWYKGKKMHELRYYKEEANARAYIDTIELDY